MNVTLNEINAFSKGTVKITNTTRYNNSYSMRNTSKAKCSFSIIGNISNRKLPKFGSIEATVPSKEVRIKREVEVTVKPARRRLHITQDNVQIYTNKRIVFFFPKTS
jgi:hypothetical protein